MPIFPAAQKALLEFGNLRFKTTGEVIFEPSAGDEIKEEIREAEKTIGRPLYPLGAADGGDYMWLLIDDAGRIYTYTCILEPFAPSMEQAVEFLARGRMTRQEWTEIGPGSEARQ
jgi:hypothetical protein